VVLVGDRGMITEARITADIKSAGLDWITAQRGPAIKDLLNSGALQLTLFDQRDMLAFRSRLLAKARNADMASITSPDFPGERLVVCRNPDLAAERSRKREELLTATEKDLAAIQARVERKRTPLHGTTAIALAVGAVLNTYKMRKHFDLNITDDGFSFARKTAEIAAEAATDGLYVVRTSVVAQAQRSKTAVKEQTTGMTPDGLPVHSFRTLLADLATMARNTTVTAINPLYPLTVVTRPTLVQQKASDLLGLAV
jgi:hypothetical protein